MPKESHKYIGSKNYFADPNTKFHNYTLDTGFSHELGLEVLDNQTDSVSVCLFHWEHDLVKQQQKILTHYVANEVKESYLKVYENKKGRFFIYNNRRIYLPSNPIIIGE